MTFIHSISAWVPPWLIGVITIIVPAIVVLVIYRWFTRKLIRLAGRYSPFLQRLLARGQGPASLILVIFVSGPALAGANLPFRTHDPYLLKIAPSGNTSESYVVEVIEN